MGKQWRSFASDRKTAEARNFIDGDLLESFLDLKRDKMEQVARGIQFRASADAPPGSMRSVTVDELVKVIEDLARIQCGGLQGSASMSSETEHRGERGSEREPK